jgi:hypothetical protein
VMIIVLMVDSGVNAQALVVMVWLRVLTEYMEVLKASIISHWLMAS